MQQRKLIVMILCAYACSAFAGTEITTFGMALRADATLQVGVQKSKYFAALMGAESTVKMLEGRINIRGQCVEEWCDGTNFILRPRIYMASEQGMPASISDHPSKLVEGYVIKSAGQSTQFGFGKRLIGWGPALLYSPSNRLFPDNGAISPRREIPGKPMVFVNSAVPFGGQATLIVADAREQTIFREPIGGAFVAARGEWQEQGDKIATVGVVASGGAGLANSLGMYAQRGITDAITLGVETSLSRKYASDQSVAHLAQNQGGMKWDMVANLRYGFSSGAEAGVEYIRNGYAMTGAEQANPLLAALPSSGSNPSWSRPMHPLVQREYALVQVTAPSLFGDKHWAWTARVLRGLDKSSTDVFTELAWSFTESATLYAGYSQSRVASSLEMTRPIKHSAYLILESFF